MKSVGKNEQDIEGLSAGIDSMTPKIHRPLQLQKHNISKCGDFSTALKFLSWMSTEENFVRRISHNHPHTYPDFLKCF